MYPKKEQARRAGQLFPGTHLCATVSIGVEAHNVTLRRKAAVGAAMALVCALTACTKTQFEREHDAALKDNPWGVELEIRSAGDVHKFHPGDTLQFQELYTSKSQRMWQLEVLDHANLADVANIAFISDGKSTQQEPYENSAVSCCNWRFVLLDDDPVKLPLHAQDQFRTLRLPTQPGRYEIYVQTHRLVLRKGSGLDPETHTGYPLTSNLFKLEITP